MFVAFFLILFPSRALSVKNENSLSDVVITLILNSELVINYYPTL